MFGLVQGDYNETSYFTLMTLMAVLLVRNARQSSFFGTISFVVGFIVIGWHMGAILIVKTVGWEGGLPYSPFLLNYTWCFANFFALFLNIHE
jgi:hypothetical protein